MGAIEREQPPQPPTKLTREQLYAQQLPDALRIQQGLIEDLRAIGVIDMINAVITPDVITPNKTREEELKIWKRAKAEQLKKPRVTTYMDPRLVSKIWFEMWDQKWQGGIFYPSQREDGSLDPTLRIGIDNDTTSFEYYHEDTLGPLKSIIVSYSPERVLTIEGTETTFKGVVTRENVDKDAISTAFGKALQRPTIQHLPSSRPSDAEMSAYCNF